MKPRLSNDRREVLRFLVLVWSGLLVAVVSAPVYSYMHTQTSPITPKRGKVVFEDETILSLAKVTEKKMKEEKIKKDFELR